MFKKIMIRPEQITRDGTIIIPDGRERALEEYRQKVKIERNKREIEERQYFRD
jgi:hypothetical protein